MDPNNNPDLGDMYKDLLQRQQIQKEQLPQMPYQAENYQYLRELVDITKGVPDDIQAGLWIFWNKVLQLDNISPKEANRWENLGEIILVRLEIATPKRFKGPNYQGQLAQAKLALIAAIWRSVGGFERIQQTTTRNEGVYRYQQQQQKSKGLIGRFLG